MKYVLSKIVIAVFIVFYLCSSSYAGQAISLFNQLNIPVPILEENMVLGDGPLFVARKNPLLVYRVMKESEIEFSGSDKSVYDFFNTAFSGGGGVAERSFHASFEGYETSCKERNNLTFFMLENGLEARLYIVSPALNFAVEIIAEGDKSKELISEVMDETTLNREFENAGSVRE